MKTLRLFISSPGDVSEERERARQVVESLRRKYARQFYLKPLFWEDLPLQEDMSFQQGIDQVLSQSEGVDIAIFILWSRLGSPLGTRIQKADGSDYRSGTERELDLMRRARQQSGGSRPALIVYTRRDEPSFEERLRGKSTQEKQSLIAQKGLVERFIAEEFHDEDGGHNLRAYHSYDRPVTFSQRLRVHLTELLDQWGGGSSTSFVWDIEKRGPPFLGLAAFEPLHADVFFGREAEILEARHAMREQAREGCSFLLLSGASGSGKSSLAMAGILPAIIENELDDQVAHWRTIVVSPQGLGPDPLLGLMRRLAEDTILPELRGEKTTPDDLAEDMRHDPLRTVERWFSEAFARASRRLGGGLRVLLLLDQLEELFVGPKTSAIQRQQLLAALEALARSGQIWILATVRSDFAESIQSQPVLVRMMSGHGLLHVLPPETDALRRLIEEPARLAGLSFEVNQQGESLADRILRDAAHHAELLPLLEYVLRELFEKRTARQELLWSAYAELGGVEGALARRAEEVFQKLPPDAQASLDTVLKELVSIGKENADGTEQVTRQRVALKHFSQNAAAQALITAFVNERLLTTEEDHLTHEGTVTVTHESLLRVWPRALEWAARNRDFLITRSRIAARLREGSPLLEGDPLLDSAKLLLAPGADLFSKEQREFVETSLQRITAAKLLREKTRQHVLIGLCTLTTLALLAAAWAWLKTREATQSEKIALAAGQSARSEAKRSQMEAHRAETAEQKTLQKSKEQAEQLLRASRADYSTAQDFFTLGQWRKGIVYLGRSLSFNPNNQAAAFTLWQQVVYGTGDRDLLPQLVLNVGEIRVERVQFSQDGKRVLVKGHESTLIFDATSGATISDLPDSHDYSFHSADGKVLLWHQTSGEGPSNVCLVDADTGKKRNAGITYPSDGMVSFSQKKDRVLIGSTSSSTAQIWNLETAQKVGKELPLQTEINELALSPDGERVIWSGKKSIRVWDNKEDKFLLEKTDLPSNAVGPIFSPDGSQVVFSLIGGEVLHWKLPGSELATATLLRTYPARKDALVKTAFSPTGQHLLIYPWFSDYGVPQLWDLDKGEAIELVEFGGEQTSVECHFSPDGSRLVMSAKYRPTQMWDVFTGKLVCPLEQGESFHAFSRDGARLVTSNDRSQHRVRDASTGQMVGAPLDSSPSYAGAAVFDESGSRVCTVGDSVKIWNVSQSRVRGLLLPHTERVKAALFSEPGDVVATISDDRQARFWNGQTGELLTTSPPITDYPISARLSSNGKHLAVLGYNPSDLDNIKGSGFLLSRYEDEIISKTFEPRIRVEDVAFAPNSSQWIAAQPDREAARMWSTENGQEIQPSLAHDGAVLGVGYSGDGLRIITAGADGTARVWNAATHESILDPIHHDSVVWRAALSWDGREVVTVGEDGFARRWNGRTGAAIGEAIPLTGTVQDAVISADGQWVGTVAKRTGSKYEAYLHSLSATSQPPKVLKHIGPIWSMAISANSQLAATASWDHTVKLWEVSSGNQWGMTLQHDSHVDAVSFSANGQRLISSSQDETARIWDVPLYPVSNLSEIESLVELVSGLRFDAQEELQEIPQLERMALRKKVAALATSTEITSPWQKLTHWAASPVAERPLNPNTERTRAQWIQGVLQMTIARPNVEQEIKDLDASHPLLPILAALQENDHAPRASWLRTHAIQRLEADPVRAIQIAEMLQAIGQQALALELVQKALTQLPDDPVALRVQLLTMSSNEDAWKSGLEAFLKLPHISPDDWVEVANAAAEDQSHEAAKRIITEATKRHPNNAAMLADLGWDYLRINDVSSALLLFEKAHALRLQQPRSMETTAAGNLLAGLGITKWLLNDRKAAVKHYAQAGTLASFWLEPSLKDSLWVGKGQEAALEALIQTVRESAPPPTE